MQRSKLQKAEDGLRKLWGNEEHYGIPEKHRTSELTLHRAQEYRAICELVSRSPLQLDQLWTSEPCFIPEAFQKRKSYNFSKAIDLAKQAVLADWKNTNFETYEREMSSRRVLKRPASNGTGDRRPTGPGPRGKKRRGSQSYELSDDEDITSASEDESDGVAYGVEQNRSVASDIHPKESEADRVSLPPESLVSSARAEMAEDIVVIAGSENAEDVHGLSPELGDHANTLRQSETRLQLIQEAMTMGSHRSNEGVDKLIQTEQQLQVFRDRHAQLEERLQNIKKEISQLDKERERLRAESQVDHDLLKKLEQLAELL